MTRLNFNRPKRAFTPWYEADLLPWDARLQAPAQKPRAITRSEPPKPTPPQETPAKPVLIAADAFAGKALLRTSDLYEAREALCTATGAVIYADGACDPNPGRMGFGAVVITNIGRVELFAGGMHGTSSLAELAAADLGLAALPRGCGATVYSDSQYLVLGMTDRARTRLLKLRRGTPVPNADLWRVLDQHNTQRSIKWEWIRGHSGNRGNEIADRLATLGRTQP